MTNCCGYFVFLVALTTVAIAVNIDNLKVPSEYILNNVDNPEILILDCVYNIPVDEGGFVLSWYFNEQLIYQWISIRGRPRFFWHPLIRNNIDLSYTASDDVHYKYRALAITKPRLNMSGTYTCYVSTFQSEDKRSKHMQIIIPETDFQLKVEEATNGNGNINVECLAKDVYPEPKMVISFDNTNQTSNGFVSETKRDDKNELWSITLYGQIKQSQDPFDVHCILFLPNTSYVKQKDIYAFNNFTSSDEIPQFTTSCVNNYKLSANQSFNLSAPTEASTSPITTDY